MDFPVDFQKLAQLPPNPNGSGYPHAISGADLMRNFKAAAVEVLPTQACGLYLKEVVSGETRQIQLSGYLDMACVAESQPPTPEGETPTTYGIPAPPTSGTYVLGSVNGVMQWLETEAC
jgi:hypothetical protein